MRKILIVLGALFVAPVLTSSASATPPASIDGVPLATAGARVQQIMRAGPGTPLSATDRAVLNTALLDGTDVTSSTPSAAPNPTLSAESASVGRHHVRARMASACYGGVSVRATHYLPSWAGGAAIGWTQVGISGWCSNGAQITSISDWNFPYWVQWPYCFGPNPTASYHGGEGTWVNGHSTWAHGLNHGNFGESSAYGCATGHTVDAALRLAYNGYHDAYNDWGF